MKPERIAELRVYSGNIKYAEVGELLDEIERLRDRFIRSYASKSNTTPERLAELGQVAIPCDCDEPTCLGWQMVSKEAAARAAGKEGSDDGH